MDLTNHDHQFPEEETPEGVRLLLPCLFCGLPAGDAMKLAQAELDEYIQQAAELILEAERDNVVRRLSAENARLRAALEDIAAKQRTNPKSADIARAALRGERGSE